MQLKQGINTYLLANKYFIEWISEYSISIMNVEQYCVPEEKESQKHVYIVYFSAT